LKRYTALTKNFFRQLARGEQVAYFDYQVEAREDKILVRAQRRGYSLEAHYRRRPGDQYGFSKEQFSRIFANREKPLFTVRTPGGKGD
jgi:hypothetical protein